MKKLVTILFVLLVFISGLFSETWIYKREVVIIPVGEKENEISLNDYKDGQQEGPTRFVVDEDENLYLKTSRLNIIKKFDKNGNYICSSKFIKGCGDFIRFLGYSNGTVYTMSANSTTNPVVRRYDKDLNYIDCHIIKKDFERQMIGIGFITNYKNEIGFLRHYSPNKITFKKLVLENNYWRMKKTKLMDFSYKKVDLSKYCKAIGFVFVNYDKNNNLYFQALIGNNVKDKIFIVTPEGKVIKTNILLDDAELHGMLYFDFTKIYISREGVIYNILPLVDGFRYVKWRKVREEK